MRLYNQFKIWYDIRLNNQLKYSMMLYDYITSLKYSMTYDYITS